MLTCGEGATEVATEAEEDEEAEDEESSSSSEEEQRRDVLHKPVYVPRKAREALNGGVTLMDESRLKQTEQLEMEAKMAIQVQEYNKIKLSQAIADEQKQKQLREE